MTKTEKRRRRMNLGKREKELDQGHDKGNERVSQIRIILQANSQADTNMDEMMSR